MLSVPAWGGRQEPWCFLSRRLVNKSTGVKHHRVYTNVYLSLVVLYMCVAVLAVLMSPMCSPVPACTCLCVRLIIITAWASLSGCIRPLPCCSRCCINLLVIPPGSRCVFVFVTYPHSICAHYCLLINIIMNTSSWGVSSRLLSRNKWYI